MVTKETVRLASVVAALGTTRFDTYEGLVAIQRKMYLLSTCGVDLGYLFQWDLYGPYSRTLWAHLVAYIKHRGEIDSIAVKLRFSAQAQNNIARGLGLMPAPAGQAVPHDAWLELVCAVHYLAQYAHDTSDSFREIFSAGDDAVLQWCETEVMPRKPHLGYCQPVLQIAWDRMRPLIQTRERLYAYI